MGGQLGKPWSAAETWAANDATPRTMQLGGPSGSTREPGQLGLLRISHRGNLPLAVPVRVTLQLGDQGSDLGPFDLPIAIVCEQPVIAALVPVVPIGGSPAIQVLAQVTPVSDWPVEQYATRTESINARSSIDLPVWVRRVTVMAGGSVQYLDRAAGALGAAFGAAAASIACIRPALAVALTASANSVVVLEY